MPFYCSPRLLNLRNNCLVAAVVEDRQLEPAVAAAGLVVVDDKEMA